MEKINQLIKNTKLLKFVSAGILNTGVDWLVFYFASEILQTDNILAKVWGTFAGVSSAFVLSALWVFRQSFIPVLVGIKGIAAQFQYIIYKYLQTISAYAAGMLLNVLIFYLLSKVGVMSIFALTAATGCSFIVNYLLSDKLVFKVIK